jgi:TM2 domain-containing membrane protein YozV
MCERDYAGPECSVMRKSQTSAFFWSLFLGFLGADYFYLGFPLWGVAKLCSLGGFGFWWLTDIIRTASGPVYAKNFRTANDLPHWVAMVIVLGLVSIIAFAISAEWYLTQRKKRRADVAKMEHDEETRSWKESWRNETRKARRQLRKAQTDFNP